MTSKLKLSDSIETLTGIGPKYKTLLKRLNLSTLNQLIHHYPSRYLTYSTQLIKNLKPNQTVILKAKILKLSRGYGRSKKTPSFITINDSSGNLKLSFFNQPYLLNHLKTNQEYFFIGITTLYQNQLTLTSPRIFSLGDPPLKIQPIYPETQGLSSRQLYRFITQALSQLIIKDSLPTKIIQENQLISLEKALQIIHQPQSNSELHLARQRLGFDELLELQLTNQYLKRQRQSNHLNPFTPFKVSLNAWLKPLPFTPTKDQYQAIEEIISDLKKPLPMNRLLQGDVGSGKTLVAASAAYLTFLNGFQTLFMCPTTILAQQHFKTLTSYYKNLTISPQIGLITSQIKINPQADIIIGTQALLHNPNYSNIGLTIIDEQHRFGVAQRTALNTFNKNKHLLSLTATPIPRTLALTFFSHLNLSKLSSLPAGRQPITTWLIPKSKHPQAITWLKDQLKLNAQAYIIYPLIEPSAQIESDQDIKAATSALTQLKPKLKPFKVGLLHGRLPQIEKNSLIQAFRHQKIQILITTTVIEVGIDIPSANIILINNPEHFGLAQLHQLRGRIGRGTEKSYCLIFTDSTQNERLNYFKNTSDGAKLALYDLKSRGPGQLYHLKQHGHLNLKLTDLSDLNLIKKTISAANYWLEHPTSDLNNYLNISKITTISLN